MDTAQLTEQINQYSADLLAWTKGATTFVQDQAPLVVQEIVHWGIASTSFGMVVGVCLFAIGATIGLSLYRGWDTFVAVYNAEPDYLTKDRLQAAQVIRAFLSVVGVVVGSGVALASAYNLVYVITAPRLYIISQLHQLI